MHQADRRRENDPVGVDGDASMLQTMLDASPDGMLFLDANGATVTTNRAFEDLLGARLEPGRGLEQQVGIVFEPDGRGLALEDLPSYRALAGERTQGRELVYVRADGARVPVIERAAPVRARDGTLLGAVVTSRDITQQKEAERLREELAAMVAHDLRNPIQSMFVQLELLRRRVEEGKPVELSSLDLLARIGSRLAQLAGDLLDSTRIDLAYLALDRKPLEVVAEVASVIDRLQPTLGEHEVSLHVEGVVPPIEADPVRFEQILTNLLDNAAKYSAESAPIEVGIEKEGKGVTIWVRDHGAGIPPSEVARLFDRFHQARRARERRTGLGLGLYITKGFVEAHGGRISLESVVSEGTTFRVWMPSSSTQMLPS